LAALSGITGADHDKLVKILGMLGSSHDGEVLAAARKAEEERKRLNTSWDQLIR
jgi:hypothetical protein